MSSAEYKSVEEIRLENLHRLIAAFGIEEVVRLTPIKKGVLGQYRGSPPRRRIGRELARNFEKAFRYPPFWLDHEYRGTEEARLLAVVNRLDKIYVESPDSFCELAQGMDTALMQIEWLLRGL